MHKIISFEDACNLERVLNNIDVKTETIFTEANNDGRCSIVINQSSSPPSVDILVKDDSISDDVLGYLIVLFQDEISVWIARDYQGGIVSGSQVCSLKRDASLNEIISKCNEKINTCPICNKTVPYKQQGHYSFAGRCCKDCLPAMKEKYETSGWNK